jgi:hypothetical protein
LQSSVKSTNKSGSLGQSAALPWAKSNLAGVLDLKVGSISGVESNVLAPYGNDNLLNLDTRSGYINPTTHLYHGCCKLKLPEDPDKQFCLTSLAAPVKGSVAPPRLTGPQAFEKFADVLKEGHAISTLCDQIPTAVQVRVGMNITNQVAVQSTHVTTADSTATTSGAKPVLAVP